MPELVPVSLSTISLSFIESVVLELGFLILLLQIRGLYEQALHLTFLLPQV